jgi:hypothetical protein
MGKSPVPPEESLRAPQGEIPEGFVLSGKESDSGVILILHGAKSWFCYYMKTAESYKKGRSRRQGYRQREVKQPAAGARLNIPVTFASNAGHWEPLLLKGRPSVSPPQSMRRLLVLSPVRPAANSPLQSMVRKVIEALRQT